MIDYSGRTKICREQIINSKTELQDKLHNFDTLQDRIIEEKQRLGYLANTETTEQTIQSVQQRLTKMHEDICKGYASKIAVDWMSNEDIRSKTVQFEQMVNDIVIAGGDGPKFNENSEMYAAFEDNIFDKTPFKEEFRKGMAAMCNEQKPTAETIRRLSDSIIKTEIQKNYNDENKMENIRPMAQTRQITRRITRTTRQDPECINEGNKAELLFYRLIV